MNRLILYNSTPISKTFKYAPITTSYGNESHQLNIIGKSIFFWLSWLWVSLRSPILSELSTLIEWTIHINIVFYISSMTPTLSHHFFLDWKASSSWGEGVVKGVLFCTFSSSMTTSSSSFFGLRQSEWNTFFQMCPHCRSTQGEHESGHFVYNSFLNNL